MGFVPLPKEPKKVAPSPGIRRRFGDGMVEYVHRNGVIGRVPIFSCVNCGREQVVSPIMPSTEALQSRKICLHCFDDEKSVRAIARREERDARLALRAELMRGYIDTHIMGGEIPPVRRRQIAFALACVEWRDRERIAEIYKDAKRISEETGIMQDVDHIYPIQSIYGCGLHVHQNLRIIAATENRAKSNKFPLHDSPALT